MAKDIFDHACEAVVRQELVGSTPFIKSKDFINFDIPEDSGSGRLEAQVVLTDFRTHESDYGDQLVAELATISSDHPQLTEGTAFNFPLDIQPKKMFKNDAAAALLAFLAATKGVDPVETLDFDVRGAKDDLLEAAATETLVDQKIVLNMVMVRRNYIRGTASKKCGEPGYSMKFTWTRIS